MDEFGVRALGPTPRRFILLARKNAHRNRDSNTLRIKEATLVLPIKTRRRDSRVRHPVKRYVVEDLITRQFASRTCRTVESRGDSCRRLAISIIVVEEPGGEADG